MKKIIYLITLFAIIISCKDKKMTKEEIAGYKKQGMSYAMNTKAVLGKNLMGQILKNGEASALAFCNERAYPLTDSMATVQNVYIKRVSDKNRNPNNKANNIELKHIQTFKTNLATDKDISPIIEEKDGKIHFYAPIFTNGMCLKCHGSPKKGQIKPEVVKLLSNLYPEDKATGYDTNQIRGIWSIVFDKK